MLPGARNVEVLEMERKALCSSRLVNNGTDKVGIL